tara:strand:+ start:2458 stop:2781 length:324 start_codon:yes stop_codon:yes gene_type:complete
MATTINLDELTDGGRVHNLSGRPLGERSREWANIEGLDVTQGPVEVRIPDHVYSVSPSFFLGMFGKSVVRCNGAEPFFEKYRFDGPGHVLTQIHQAAGRALLELPAD